MSKEDVRHTPISIEAQSAPNNPGKPIRITKRMLLVESTANENHKKIGQILKDSIDEKRSATEMAKEWKEKYGIKISEDTIQRWRKRLADQLPSRKEIAQTQWGNQQIRKDRLAKIQSTTAKEKRSKSLKTFYTNLTEKEKEKLFEDRKVKHFKDKLNSLAKALGVEGGEELKNKLEKLYKKTGAFRQTYRAVRQKEIKITLEYLQRIFEHFEIKTAPMERYGPRIEEENRRLAELALAENRLTEKERKILELRYTSKGATLEEIGKQLKLTKQAIHYRETKTLARARKLAAKSSQ